MMNLFGWLLVAFAVFSFTSVSRAFDLMTAVPQNKTITGESVWLYPELRENLSKNFDNFVMHTSMQNTKNLASSSWQYVSTAFRNQLKKIHLVGEDGG